MISIWSVFTVCWLSVNGNAFNPAKDIIEFDVATAEITTLTIDVHFKRNRDFTIFKLQCVGTGHILPDSSPLHLRGWYLKLPVKDQNFNLEFSTSFFTIL